MKGIFSARKLGAKLLFTVAVSFVAALTVITVISQTAVFYYMSGKSISVFYYNLTNFLMISAAILVFVVIFFLLIRKKMNYLKLITDQVSEIAGGSLGKTVPIKGNDELAELCKNINDMSKQLKQKFEYEKKMETAKNELITSVSHDLRTPLTSMIGFLDLLRKKQYHDEEQLLDYLEIVYSKSNKLHSLINELFEYTKLASPDVKLNPVEVDFSGLVEQVIGEYVPILEQAGLSVHKNIQEDVHASMDVEKMVRVLDNLFVNAKKYSLKPSVVKIHLFSDGGRVVFTISNQTSGELPVTDLFERFYRGDPSRNDEGSGLGLAISKKIIELHNGTVEAHYQGGWITFTVTF